MESKQNSDPSQLPPYAAMPLVNKPLERQRNRRLLYVLYGSLPLIAVLLLSGLALLSLQLFSWLALQDYQAGEQTAASRKYQTQINLTAWGFVPWVSQYNLGTVLLQEEDWAGAQEQLEQAFQSVPKAIVSDEGKIQSFSYECQVRTNLALAWEGMGDQQAAEDSSLAQESYAKALDWVSVCELSSSSGEDETEQSGGQEQQDPKEESELDTGKSTTERIEKKQRQLSGEKSESSDSAEGEDNQPEDSGENVNPQSSPFGSETNDEQRRREELERKNNEQQERQRESEESYNRNPGSSGW